jgi:hypothetical protein
MLMVGAMVIEQVFADTQLSGSARAAQNAMYVADAGAVWGQQQLITLLYPNGIGSAGAGPPSVSALLSLPNLPNNDAMCPDLTGAACSRWFLLSPAPLPGWVSYGPSNSRYRVAVTCNPQPCSLTSSPVNFSIRAMSQSNDGSRRLIEVVMGP